MSVVGCGTLGPTGWTNSSVFTSRQPPHSLRVSLELGFEPLARGTDAASRGDGGRILRRERRPCAEAHEFLYIRLHPRREIAFTAEAMAGSTVCVTCSACADCARLEVFQGRLR